MTDRQVTQLPDGMRPGDAKVVDEAGGTRIKLGYAAKVKPVWMTPEMERNLVAALLERPIGKAVLKEMGEQVLAGQPRRHRASAENATA